ncbi:DUF3263 domain-containing protein [Micromonospora sp. WMMD998]|uniref:DUF3263 domain-containing protein n=1 Tax=Micromonospora sp. WMMD998 TaxID=3016092 RepID=UPI00249AFE93|nr:DUF3263 domain-containing protein [Micromonospora sp. WMMD998]WFE37117.1 DUF3263 domain-containing protein [Micromonospora sp. WMMD998]
MSADAPDRTARERPDPSGPTAGTRRRAVPPPRTPSEPAGGTPVEPDDETPVEAGDETRVEDAGGMPPGAGGVDAAGDDAAGPAEADAAGGLTERERRILTFESRWWKHAGAKEQAIRDTFGLSATRYYQLLNALLDHPAALAAEPLLIGRLRRLRSSRARNRRR